MSIKFTDTQLLLMSAAAQREDRCLVASPTLKGGAAQKVASKLISAGLAKEVKAKSGDPICATGRGVSMFRLRRKDWLSVRNRACV